MYFTFRVKGQTRDRARTVIVYPKAERLTASGAAYAAVNAACRIFACERNRLVLVEPETSIQVLADRQNRLPFGGAEWCELQGAIDRLSWEQRS